MSDYADWTNKMIADLRANAGQATGGPMAGRPLMILTTTGAKSGEPRQVIVTYSRDGDAFVVAGTKSGAPEDPFWFTNLVADPNVTVEAGGESFKAVAKVAAQGADRDALWDRHVARNPEFADYPSRTTRIIPMARLTRIA